MVRDGEKIMTTGTKSSSPIIERSLGLYKVLWLERYRGCGHEYAILQCNACGRYKAVPLRCDLRVCESCARIRGRRIERHYLPLLKTHSRHDKLSFLTLTIRNIWNLEVGFKKLRKCIRKFKRSLYVKKRLKGGLYAYEVKVDENGWYNLHAHCIILHRWFGSPSRKEVRNLEIPLRLGETKGIESKEDLLRRKGKDTGQIVLSVIWENLTSDPVVDIRGVKSPKIALRYLVKYISKPPVFEKEESYVEYLRVTENHPLVVSFGCLRGHPRRWEPLECEECGSIIFFFVCIADELEVEDWVKKKDPPYFFIS